MIPATADRMVGVQPMNMNAIYYYNQPDILTVARTDHEQRSRDQWDGVLAFLCPEPYASSFTFIWKVRAIYDFAVN